MESRIGLYTDVVLYTYSILKAYLQHTYSILAAYLQLSLLTNKLSNQPNLLHTQVSENSFRSKKMVQNPVKSEQLYLNRKQFSFCVF